MGSNDFRSTKLNVVEARLLGEHEYLRVLSDGSQHVRAWMAPGGARLLVADLANEGCPACFNEYAMPRPTLRPGDRVKGAVRLQILAGE